MRIAIPRRFRRFLIVALPAGLALGTTLFGFSKAGITYTTDGSQADVSAAIAAAATGDVILVPAGAFTCGAAGSAVWVNKAVTLQGAGPGATTIAISGSGPNWGSGTIQISAAATVKDFTINQSGLANTTAFGTGTANGWRITNIVYNSAATAAYFVYAGSYGLIDSCTINGGGGSDETIFSRGPANSWQTTSSMGTADAVYIEDCTFNNSGYVCDFNSNARGVVRFCTINGPMKVDGHGLASNTPARGVRQLEVYGNQWTQTGGYYAEIEIRGGTGMLFDNTSANTQSGWFFLTDYGYEAQWPNFGNVYQTPANYPITDQIGVGQDPKAGATEPVYVWNNTRAGLPWTRTVKAVAAGAITLFGSTFTENDIVRADRDFFWQGANFDGSGGMGRGPKAAMLATTPSKTGVGWWVTDEGEWNSSHPGTDGQLYSWNGSAWIVKYTPYTYPHPLRGDLSAVAPSNAIITITVQ